MTNAFGFASGVAHLRRYISFAELTRRMIDTWLGNSGQSASADTICRSVQDYLRVNMMLLVVDVTKAPPDWPVSTVRKYRIPTSLADVETLQKASNLRDIAARGFIEQHVVATCQKAIADNRPIIGRIEQVIHEVSILGSHIVIPDPTVEKAWCVILAEIHSLSVVGRGPRFDDFDLSILQLLREGLSAREIGKVLELSPWSIGWKG